MVDFNAILNKAKPSKEFQALNSLCSEQRVEGDFETKSYADLTKVGAWAYSEHPSTEVIVFCYGIDSEPVQTFYPVGDPRGKQEMPLDLYMALMTGALFECHNVSFEYSIWKNICVKLWGWIDIPDYRWRDSMAAACYMSMPAGLDRLAGVLQFEGKDAEGGRLITKYSKLHLKTAKDYIPPPELEKFGAYCAKDVMIEQSVSDYLGDLPEAEQENFYYSLVINARGLLLDREGIANATAIVEQRSDDLTAEFQKLTGLNPTQTAKLLVWFEGQGLKLENMQADYLEELLEDGDLPQGPCRRALEVRLKINKASTKKLDAMARNAGTNGRACFQSRYHGAGTGRSTGSGFQPLNLNRGFDEDLKFTPEMLVRDISYRDASWLDIIYGDAMDAVAKASRHWIMAEPGHRIMSGDLASVEAVGLACLAGEQWKIDAFRSGAKIYELTADKIFKLPPGTVTKKTHPNERQDGKTCELACGYQGSLGAWLKFDSSGRHTDEAILANVKAWRGEHPMTTQFWRELEDAAVEAVRFPGRLTGYREIGFEMVDEWLTMILPDSKRLWYFKPELRSGMPNWHKPKEKWECCIGECDCRPKISLTYMAQKEGQWKRVSTYGGKLAENATQATCRQILMPARNRIERYGYRVILDVYDEVVAEPKIGHGSIEEFKELMLIPPRFAEDWPLGADVWEGSRYKK